MNYIRKTEIISLKQDQVKHERYETPGPGSYDIALPLIRPNYEAIKKKNDVVILKINHHGQSRNFRSEQQRFVDEKEKSPGPAHYGQLSLNLRSKRKADKKYSQRYTDLIDFMYRDRSHIEPMPDYKVQYQNEHEKALRRIKNSHRRYKQRQSQRQSVELSRKSSLCSTSNIVNIKSTSRLSVLPNETSQGQETKQKKKNQMRTIDFPGQASNNVVTKRPLPLEKEQNLVLHRVTLYNRNMLGMMMAKKSPKIQKSKVEISSELSKGQSLVFTTIDSN